MPASSCSRPRWRRREGQERAGDSCGRLGGCDGASHYWVATTVRLFAVTAVMAVDVVAHVTLPAVFVQAYQAPVFFRRALTTRAVVGLIVNDTWATLEGLFT